MRLSFLRSPLDLHIAFVLLMVLGLGFLFYTLLIFDILWFAYVEQIADNQRKLISVETRTINIENYMNCIIQ